MSRFTSYHCHNGQERSFKDKSVPGAVMRLADHVADRLTEVGIPATDCKWAFATCLIQVMGKDAHNDNGTALRSSGADLPYLGQQRWVHTELKVHSPKVVPSLDFQRSRQRGTRVWSDSFSGANAILGCFGLTMSDVIEHFGNVRETERKIFDLATIVRTLAPELLSDSRVSAVGAA